MYNTYIHQNADSADKETEKVGDQDTKKVADGADKETKKVVGKKKRKKG